MYAISLSMVASGLKGFQGKRHVIAYSMQQTVYSCMKPDYMSNREDINAQMRAILIDWLIEAQEHSRIVPYYNSYILKTIFVMVCCQVHYKFEQLDQNSSVQ